jgi:hypothetical protein
MWKLLDFYACVSYLEGRERVLHKVTQQRKKRDQTDINYYITRAIVTKKAMAANCADFVYGVKLHK